MNRTIIKQCLNLPKEAKNIRTEVVGRNIEIYYEVEAWKNEKCTLVEESYNIMKKQVPNSIQKATERNECPGAETNLEEIKGTKEWLDKYFPIVKASSLSLSDKFLQYKPNTKRQKIFKERVIYAINSGLEDFRAQSMDPAIGEDGNIYYKAGIMTDFILSAKSWQEKAKMFLPEKESRLGFTKERIVFLALLIKYLMEERGYSTRKSWKMVCDNSKDLGNFYNPKCTHVALEPTGSRQIGQWYDLGNNGKITQKDGEFDIFICVGAGYDDYPNLTNITNDFLPNCIFNHATGWVVCSI